MNLEVIKKLQELPFIGQKYIPSISNKELSHCDGHTSFHGYSNKTVMKWGWVAQRPETNLRYTSFINRLRNEELAWFS